MTPIVPHMQQVVLARSYAESLWERRRDYNKADLLAIVFISLSVSGTDFFPFSIPLFLSLSGFSIIARDGQVK